MSYERVLLIAPPTSADYGSLRPNVGLGYLAEVLRKEGIEYSVMDMMLGYSFHDLFQRIELFRPELVGVNLFSYGYKRSYQLMIEIKKHYPSINIIVGGPHVSSLREKVLEECPAIDFGVVHEGEDTLVELCQGKEPTAISGLLFRGVNVASAGVRRFAEDLDSIPFPTYRGFEIERYTREKAIISSRGCPYACLYCAVSATIGRTVRVRSPMNVVDELEYWYKKGYREFSFQDDNFTFYGKRVLSICDEIEKRGLKGLFMRCAGARADKVDMEILGRMKDVGFRSIAFGVEAGNNRMLRVLKKGENIETIEKAIKTACDLDYDVYLNFLVGSPTESPSDVQDSVKIAQKYPVFYAQFFNIIPYPATELYHWLNGKNYLLKQAEEYLNDLSPHSSDPVFETPEMPYRERIKIFSLLRKVEKDILRKICIYER